MAEINIKLNLEKEKLEKAIISLEKVCKTDIDDKRIKIDATIQRFEYTIELFWKYLKRILEINGRDINLPKAILQESYQNALISNEKIWLDMLRDRNQTSHTYNEQLADSIFHRITNIYTTEIRKVFDYLSNKDWR
jgi:nucleotidyltransferase substrate binding protein (TIGR01987 family)